jgi:hypothetical protein
LKTGELRFGGLAIPLHLIWAQRIEETPVQSNACGEGLVGEKFTSLSKEI